MGYDKHTERISSSIDAENLAENLETIFQTAMAWTREDLILTSKRGIEYPVEKTREEVEREMTRYPVPRR
ncbi:MAG: hypothetical protein IH624_02140 [Phycisphaerae bacterium]|nr:hypothetical protein [Phycisphaerae bacterium]